MEAKTEKSAIPKFTSFRPKPKPIVTPDAHTTTSAQQPAALNEVTGHKVKRARYNDDRSHHKSKRKQDRHGHEHGRTKPRPRDQLDRARPRSRSPRLDRPARQGADELFAIDRKGDPGNLTYGGIHKYRIPLYRRTGYGSILGLGARSRIDRDSTTEREIVILESGQRVKNEREILKKNPFKHQRVLVTKQQDEDIERGRSYIPIHPSHKRHRSESSESSLEPVDYRSIEGNTKSNSFPYDSDHELLSDSALGPNHGIKTATAEAKSRNIELSRRTRDDPRNVEAWLDFIRHQEAMVRLGRDPGKLTSSEEHSLADIRVSIYQEALGKIEPDASARERLLMGLMEEGSSVWGSEKTGSKWREIIKDNRSSVQLWIKYLDFVQTSFVEFRYEPCRSSFLECLGILASEEALASARDSSQTAIQQLQLYLVLRLTVLMRDAGYQEQATATWQALLEYYICRPLSLSSGASDADQASILAAFEQFWESEVPRIGEPTASGWSEFHARSESMEAPEPRTLSIDDSVDGTNCFPSFYEVEQKHMNLLREPGRTTDDAGEDDPYHIVLFSDIRPILSVLPTVIGKPALVEAFLAFHGLPPLPFSGTGTRPLWLLDPHVKRETLSQPESDEPSSSVKDAFASISACPMKHSVVTVDALFAGAFDTEHNPWSLEWVCRTLKSLVTFMPDCDGLEEYHFAFEYKFFPATALKTAKATLKKRSSKLRLYNAYALVERDKDSSMTRTISTALSMASTFPVHEQKNSVLLWRTWIWSALERNDHRTALYRLLSIVNGETLPAVSPIRENQAYEPDTGTVLRLKAYLTGSRDDAVSDGDGYLAVVHTELLALLTYLCNQRSIEIALEVFHAGFSLVKARGHNTTPADELLHQSCANLLRYHVSHTNFFKPSLLRDELSKSIKTFPNNTIFLSLYTANEARFRIDDRVRSIMREVVLGQRDQTVVGWAFAIWSEMRRGGVSGGTAHSVRATFEDALSNKSVRNSVSLWTSYVLFECRRGEHQRAKDLFLRGLTHLPWAKSYIMLAFSELSDVLTFDELKRVYNLMGEKELRVHVDLDETLEELDEARRLRERVAEDEDTVLGSE